MDKKAFDARYALYHAAIEEYLDGLFTADVAYKTLFESMRYSVLAGGKRIRPVLTLEWARICGMDWKKALPFGCALELIHNYSLIHDDLPCMDNDDFRRGKPTNHKVYGETMATLAGDALQPAAFSLIANAEDLSPVARVDGVKILSHACGENGMVAGQVLDLDGSAKDLESVRLLHSLKTGAMIMGAAELGCAAAEGSAEMRASAKEYAAQIGLAFQIRDDMLDVIGDAEVFGKPIGSDKEEGKTTFVDLLGLEGCRKAVEECTEKACEALKNVPENEFLVMLAQQLAGRNY